MFIHGKSLKNGVELGTVSDLFSCNLESTRGGHIVAVDSQLAFTGIYLSSEAFESGRLTSS